MNREEWLLKLTDKLRPWFSEKGYPLPDEIRLSCGWPAVGALAKKNRRVGECWTVGATSDKVCQIFISPLIDESAEAGGILAHELIHAVLPDDAGHKKLFKQAGSKLGMEGPANASRPAKVFQDHIDKLISEIGPYPQAKIVPKEKQVKQTTRMLKIVCESNEHEETPYILRGSKKVLEMGIPECPVCGNSMEIESQDEDEEK